MVVLMMCFNLFSHGTQDLYPTFLQKQHNFDPRTVSWIVIVANLGELSRLDARCVRLLPARLPAIGDRQGIRD
jgi:hypothetical protein